MNYDINEITDDATKLIKIYLVTGGTKNAIKLSKELTKVLKWHKKILWCDKVTKRLQRLKTTLEARKESNA